jgi:hypothetical protein
MANTGTVNKEQLRDLFKEFLLGYDPEAKDLLWQQQSNAFRTFWTSKVMGPGFDDLLDSEIDEIVRILDRNGKGNTKSSEAVARVMVPQGAWRRMFNEIRKSPKLSSLLNDVFLIQDRAKRAASLDKLYKINEKNKNNLTGKSGNAINAMLAAWDPKANVSVISLNDRRLLLEYLQLELSPLDSQTVGREIVSSNELILSGFASIGITSSARTISFFLYTPAVKPLWKPEEDPPVITRAGPPGGEGETIGGVKETEGTDRALFYLEEELENFLIRNWDQTELGKKYELIEENGDMVSQQYPTSLGPIDILVQDKATHQYVVIELKRNQTSDQTVGQLARYMGWLQDNKTKGKPTKGIIIAGKYDERLYYALKMLKDAEVYLYQVDFKLNEFKES